MRIISALLIRKALRAERQRRRPPFSSGIAAYSSGFRCETSRRDTESGRQILSDIKHSKKKRRIVLTAGACHIGSARNDDFPVAWQQYDRSSVVRSARSFGYRKQKHGSNAMSHEEMLLSNKAAQRHQQAADIYYSHTHGDIGCL